MSYAPILPIVRLHLKKKWREMTTSIFVTNQVEVPSIRGQNVCYLLGSVANFRLLEIAIVPLVHDTSQGAY